MERNIEIVNNKAYTVRDFFEMHGNYVEDASTVDTLTGEIAPRLQFGKGDARVFVCLSSGLRNVGMTAKEFLIKRNDMQIIRLKDHDHLVTDENGKQVPHEWWQGCSAGRYRTAGGEDLSNLL